MCQALRNKVTVTCVTRTVQDCQNLLHTDRKQRCLFASVCQRQFKQTQFKLGAENSKVQTP